MKRIRDASVIISSLENGELVGAFSSEIVETLKALKDQTGGRPKAKAKGSVTLKLNIEVEGNSATIDADIDSKRPKPVRGSSFYFVLDDGSLSTEHPQQQSFGFDGPRSLPARDAAEG